MNDEYLWDKTGSDTEIEGLENELKAFRYQETVAPRIPVRAFSLPEKKSSGFWRFGFAFAFAAAAIILLSGAWLLLPEDGSAVNDVAVNGVQFQSLPLANIPEIGTATAVKNPEPKPERNFVKISIANRTAVRPVRAVAKKLLNENPPVRLTPEEKYAYDQLMLALSITSSKLKIVKDTVGQIDKPNKSIERYR